MLFTKQRNYKRKGKRSLQKLIRGRKEQNLRVLKKKYQELIQYKKEALKNK